MLNRLTVKQRMYLIISAICLFFIVMVLFAIQNGARSRDMGIDVSILTALIHTRNK
jgi:methyl-accepting chemotaxis protein